MDWEILLKYLPMYERAAWLTIQIGFMGVAGATVLGLICAVIQYERILFFRQITAMYIELSRNTPLLVQLFFIYYGLPKIGIQTDPKICGIVGLAFLGGGYMAETFRSGLESVADIQIDSAISLGMNRAQVMWYVIIPQAVSVSVPSFVANIIFLLNGLYYKTTESLFLLVVFYLLILLPVSVAGSLLERRVRYAGFGN